MEKVYKISADTFITVKKKYISDTGSDHMANINNYWKQWEAEYDIYKSREITEEFIELILHEQYAINAVLKEKAKLSDKTENNNEDKQPDENKHDNPRDSNQDDENHKDKEEKSQNNNAGNNQSNNNGSDRFPSDDDSSSDETDSDNDKDSNENNKNRKRKKRKPKQYNVNETMLKMIDTLHKSVKANNESMKLTTENLSATLITLTKTNSEKEKKDKFYGKCSKYDAYKIY